MTLYVAPIVEGHTEQGCIERLLQRLWQTLPRGFELLHVMKAFRGPRDRLLQPNGIALTDSVRKAYSKLRLKASSDAEARQMVIILLDAERDCPATLAPRLVDVGKKALPPDTPISCVLAKRMLENWIVAGASTLNGVNDLPDQLPARDHFEDHSGVSWLENQLRSRDKRRKYRKTDDAEAFIRAMSLEECLANSPSFRKLRKELASLLPPAPAVTDPTNESAPPA